MNVLELFGNTAVLELGDSEEAMLCNDFYCVFSHSLVLKGFL